MRVATPAMGNELGRFHLSPDAPGPRQMPGLWPGLAGIGYELLRLSAPRDVPSLLLWA